MGGIIEASVKTIDMFFGAHTLVIFSLYIYIIYDVDI